MSLWDWLLAAWIYEEVFDDDSDERSCGDTYDNDSLYDYNDCWEDFEMSSIQLFVFNEPSNRNTY